MNDPALTPDLALDYLDELSTDIRAAVVLDSGNGLAAVRPAEHVQAEQMRDLVVGLFGHADAAASEGRVEQVEVVLAGGAVFAVRGHHWTLAVVANRYALSSLMFYDLRSVLADLGEDRTASADSDEPRSSSSRRPS